MEQRLASRDLSMDMPISDNDETTLLNFLHDNKQTPKEQFAETQYNDLLREKMELFAKNLKNKKLVIYQKKLLNKKPLTLREIGEKYDINHKQIHQIEERMKKKLKIYLSKELKEVNDTA